MTANYSILFYLKKPKIWDRGSIPIYSRITVAGVQKEMSVGRSCLPERSCSRTCREKGSKESTKLLNAYLDELERKAEEAHTALTRERKEVTALAIRNRMQGKDELDGSPRLMEIFEKHNQAMKDLLGIEYQPNTLKGYNTTVGHLRAFIQNKRCVPDVFLAELDYSFIEDFDHFLKTDLKCSPVSAAKYLKNLRKIVNNCIKKRLLETNPFLGYKSKAKAKDREFLTQAQLDRIAGKDIYENAARVRFADLKNFHAKEFSDKPYVYCIVGEETNLNMEDMKKLGEFRKLSLEEIFGY